MNWLKICTDYRLDRFSEEWNIVNFEEREDGWYVNTELIDSEGWRLYANPTAKERDVKQLLRKEYDVRY